MKVIPYTSLNISKSNLSPIFYLSVVIMLPINRHRLHRVIALTLTYSLCFIFILAQSISQSPRKSHIDLDKLPSLLPFLDSLNISSYVPNMIKLGVTETVHLLKLSSMDYHIMSYDWNMPDHEIQLLKTQIDELRAVAVVYDDTSHRNYDIRDKTNYGRVYIMNGVQSFEYMKASFGGSPPIGYREIVLADSSNVDACKEIQSATGLFKVHHMLRSILAVNAVEFAGGIFSGV